MDIESWVLLMAGTALVIVAIVIIIKDRRHREILVCSLSRKVAEPVY